MRLHDPEQRLLMLTSGSEHIARASEQLRDQYQILTTTSEQECLDILRQQRMDLLLVPAHACSEVLIKSVESLGLSHALVLLADDTSSGRMLSTLAANHAFNAFPWNGNIDELSSHLRLLLNPRTANRLTLEGFAVRVSFHDGVESVYPILDLSNRGCAFRATPGAMGGRFLPGTLLSSVAIAGGEGPVLEGQSGIVRYLQVLHADAEPRPIQYKVGVEFVARRAPHVHSLEQKLDQPLRIRLPDRICG